MTTSSVREGNVHKPDKLQNEKVKSTWSELIEILEHQQGCIRFQL